MGDNWVVPKHLTSAALSWYTTPSRYISLDFETNSFDKGSPLNESNHLVLACWYIVTPEGITKKSCWGDEYNQQELEEDIKAAQFVIAHNAKFELGWLKRMGMELRDILVFDTYLAEWVIAGNRKWELGLEATAGRYGLGSKLSLAAKCIKLGIDPENIPKEWLLPYCFQDVELAHQLYIKQMRILLRDGLLHLAHTRNICCAALADIEFNGCELDPEKVGEAYAKAIEEFHRLEEELDELTGGVNLSSPKQVGEYLYGKLGFDIPSDHKGNKLINKPTKAQLKKDPDAIGSPKTDVNTLALLRANTKEQEVFLELYGKRNKLDALISKNLKFFQKVVEERGGKFYGIFNQGFTKTHRLSASGRPIVFDGEKTGIGAQLQNLPRDYKYLFTAYGDDWEIHEYDGAQLEFRVAAEEGHDETATREIIEGADIHSVTASVLTEAGQKTSRQEAKSRTFTPLFAGGGKTKAEKEYSTFFKKKYHQLFDVQTMWTYEVLEKGYMIAPYGMRWYFPGTKQSKRGYIDNTTTIFNISIQGFATAEIIPIALVYFWHRTRDLPVIIWNTIHDSIASRIRKDARQQAMQHGKEALTNDVYRHLADCYNYKFSVPLGVGAKVAKNWAATKEEHVWDVMPDGSEKYKLKT